MGFDCFKATPGLLRLWTEDAYISLHAYKRNEAYAEHFKAKPPGPHTFEHGAA